MLGERQSDDADEDSGDGRDDEVAIAGWRSGHGRDFIIEKIAEVA